MKKIIVAYLFLGLISCKAQEKKVVVVEHVTITQFQKLITEKGAQLVDVRTPKEYEEGHIENALLINFFDKDFNEQSLKALDKNKPVYIYCRSGGRSAKAAEMYEKAGFTKVYNLLGGMNAWSEGKLKIEK